MKLFKHQEEGINFLLKKTPYKGLILADEQGLGKTLQAILAAKKKGKGQKLIVCPASLKFNWEEEINKWCPGDLVYVIGGKIDKILDDYEWLVINYDMLAKHNEILTKYNYLVIICDEFQAMRNPDSGRSRAFRGYIPKRKKRGTKTFNSLVNCAPITWYLSGTPLNRPMDLFNVLNMINHPVAKSQFSFGLTYCNGKKDSFGRWNFKGASRVKKLRKEIEPVFLRRTKEECLDLPEKMRRVVLVEIDMKEYNKHWKEYKAKYIKDKNKNNRSISVVELTQLKEAAAIGKIPHSIELIDEILEADQKVILFTDYREVAQKIAEHYKDKSVSIVGGMSSKQKMESANEFQSNENIRVCIGNLIAASAGYTLTAATQVIVNDFSYNPTNHLQAEDRPHRIGQKNNVTITYLTAKNTHDEKLCKIITEKMKNISQIVDGKSPEENEVYGELISMLEEMV